MASLASRFSSDDWGLVARAKSGSSGAFGQLYERHRARVYHTAFRILRQREDAEDAVQRCFQRAFTNLVRFRGDSRFSTWVTRIAINEALMLLRQRRANTTLSEASHEDTESPFVLNLADGAPTAEQTVAAKRTSRRPHPSNFRSPEVPENRPSAPRISWTHERGDRSTSRFERGRRQSTSFPCKTLAPAATRTKTQANKKLLSD